MGTPARAGPVPKRLFPVFRDREELPTSADLGGNIRDSLSQSSTLIVICSPHSARSKWVNEEIKTYKSMGHANHVLCLIVGGEPNSGNQNSDESDECFPEAVRFQVDQSGNILSVPEEPIAADLRQGWKTQCTAETDWGNSGSELRSTATA